MQNKRMLDFLEHEKLKLKRPMLSNRHVVLANPIEHHPGG